MSLSVVSMTSLVFIYAIQSNNLSSLYAITLGINVGYFYKYCVVGNFNGDQMIKYLLNGQNLHGALYIVWLAVFKKETYLFFVPVFFSTIAKLYWLLISQQKVNSDFLEEASLFQAKTQIFVFGYTLLTLLYGGVTILTQLLFLVLVMKFKYSFHQKTQEAYKQLHFSIDNLLKRTKLRPKYQKLVQLFGLIGNIYGGSKQIVY